MNLLLYYLPVTRCLAIGFKERSLVHNAFEKQLPKFADKRDHAERTPISSFIVVTLYNRLSKPIRVFGGGTSCTCVTLENIPLEIPANSRRELAVRFKVGEHLRGQKEFTSSLVYYLEGDQFLVRGVLRGSIFDSR